MSHNKSTLCVTRIIACVLLGIAGVGLTASAANRQDDQKALAKLDADYQKAVEQNDTKTMARILADDFILVEGDGTVSTKADLLKDAAGGKTKYEHQVDSERTIRVWGDTAVVTAKLWAKGLEDGKQVDYYMWFSDTYVRKSSGWSYVFGQASLALPKASKQYGQ
jgi:ketosteroid isomerase-like protein